LNRPIVYLVDATLVLTKYLVALIYLGKITKTFPITPSGYEMAAKKVAFGVVLSPHQHVRVKV